MKTNVARLLMAAGVLFAVTMATAGPAAADCPAPSISINPTSGRGGDTFHIDGRNFFQSCSDAGNVGDTNIQFRFLQGSNVYDLGSATAGTPNGDFSGTLFVPTNTTAGGATVQAFGSNGSPSAPFTVTQSTVAGGGVTPATTPRASTATTAAPTATTAASTATTASSVQATTTTTAASTTATTAATTVTTSAPAAASSSSGLTGGGLAVTIVLLVLVVVGTIIAALATAGRLPMPKGRPRPRVERAKAAEAAAAAGAAAVGAGAGVAGAAAADYEQPDRFESSAAPIEPIPDPFAPEPDEPTAAVDTLALDDGDEEPSAPVESAVDDEEPPAPVEAADDGGLDDSVEADSVDEASAPVESTGDEVAFPDDADEHDT
jgi:hypothetical protein